MPTLKLIYLKILHRAGALPRSVATVIEARRQRASRDAMENERLDCIRNPSKYRGKCYPERGAIPRSAKSRDWCP